MDMNFIDCLLLTFVNITLCLSFPKLLSLILAPQTQQTKSVKPALTAPVIEPEASSFLPLES
jgi:hypothetical protein